MILRYLLLALTLARRLAPVTSQSAAAANAVSCSDGAAGDFPCSNIDLQSHLELSTFGDSSSLATNVWGWTHNETNREFALIGLNDGTAMVEITDPVNPIYLGKLPTHQNEDSVFRDIKVFNNHAFIVSNAHGHGMQVFNLTELMSVSEGDLPATFTPTAHLGYEGRARNIVINEGTNSVYILGPDNECNGHIHMVDISSLAAPMAYGCLHTPSGRTRDAHCVVYQGPIKLFKGHDICFFVTDNSVEIMDVSKMSRPRRLSFRRTFSDGAGGSPEYGRLSDDHSYFILGDRLDEIQQRGINTTTWVMDVQNLMYPKLVGGPYVGTSKATDRNLYTKDGFVYLASSRAGLRILRIDDLSIANYFTEVGYFDTFPASNSAGLVGAFSVFPDFPSGNVIVSDTAKGLFVLKFNDVGLPPPPEECNRDGVCDPEENCLNCSEDCASGLDSENPSGQYCCGGNLSPDCGHADCACHFPLPTEPTQPTECEPNGGTCSTRDDCCSENCNNGSCLPARRLGESFHTAVQN